MDVRQVARDKAFAQEIVSRSEAAASQPGGNASLIIEGGLCIGINMLIIDEDAVHFEVPVGSRAAVEITARLVVRDDAVQSVAKAAGAGGGA